MLLSGNHHYSFNLYKRAPYKVVVLLLRWVVEMEKGVIHTKINGHIYTVIFLTPVL